MQSKRYCIAKGTVVEFQHKLIEWPPFEAAENIEFILIQTDKDSWALRASGFGLLGSDERYGYGPVYVKSLEGVIPLEQAVHA